MTAEESIKEVLRGRSVELSTTDIARRISGAKYRTILDRLERMEKSGLVVGQRRNIKRNVLSGGRHTTVVHKISYWRLA